MQQTQHAKLLIPLAALALFAACATAQQQQQPQGRKSYAGVLADCTPADFGVVAKTLSPQAQALLSKANGPPEETDNSAEGFIQQRAKLNANSKALSDKYRAAYVGATNKVIDLGGVKAIHISPKAGVAINGVPSATAAARDSKNVIFYMHGGAYTLGDPAVQYQSYAPLAVATGMDAYAIDYRLAPEHPYPAALDDAVAAYQALLKKVPAKNIVVAGGSAGAHLTAALLLRLANDKLPLPAAAVLFSPWALLDMNDTDTHYTLRCADPFLNFNALNAAAHLYKGNASFDSPYLSPGKAPWAKHAATAKSAGFSMPPVQIFVGTREMLFGDSAALSNAMRQAGMDVDLRIYNGMWHSWSVGTPGAMMLPEAEQSTREAAEFIRKHLKA